MRDGFVPLAAWLRPSETDENPVAPPERPNEDFPNEDRPDEELMFEVGARVRRFRAMLDDALERSLQELLREIAVVVVGRELHSAPADLEAIVRRARERCALEQPLAVRVHPSQASSLRLDVPVIADPQLRSDDVMIDLRSGSIDASLGARIECLLAAYDG